MYKFDNEKDSINSPYTSIGYFVLFMMAGWFVGGVMAVLVYSVFTGIPFQEVPEAMTNFVQYPDTKIGMLLLQGVYASIFFIVSPYLCFRFIEKKGFQDLNRANNSKSLLTILLGILAIILLAPLNNQILEWNRMMPVPSWMIEKQQESDALITFITTYDNTTQYILSFISIALVAAIGEELVFRGLLQNILYRISKNPHFAIWVTAALFSAIHLQFQDFFVRMILGALLGYIYYWSGNILVPMIVHFFNNAITIILFDLANNEVVTNDIESIETIGFAGLFSSTVLFILCIYFFRKISYKPAKADE